MLCLNNLFNSKCIGIIISQVRKINLVVFRLNKKEKSEYLLNDSSSGDHGCVHIVRERLEVEFFTTVAVFLVRARYLNHSDRVSRTKCPDESQPHRASLEVDAAGSQRKKDVSLLELAGRRFVTVRTFSLDTRGFLKIIIV